ncbi:MAG: Stk1 family PASTA domain-containing Ser/Thr kinase [Lachnospiraceae bacterium]|nr:Stk1 family PASTA domain-containing Ser/Thr kinase [Lachnospiraceae bacterium]
MLKSGTNLGERYEIVGRIGSGGMADVYKAMDLKLNRFVAVKVMKPEFREDGTFISKFRREAQAAAGLANPNIVNVFDVGEDQGNYYIVMELVEGITLKDYIAKKGKLSVREATSIAIQVCMGLAAAHAQGIVHRDVKPQNIIISTDGKVKVTDFGIARAASSNTISANAMGSVHYSSPEQVRGGYSDSRSDIYSLGITLYEMVTGRVPFDGETTVAIAIKHLQDEMEPPSRYTPDLPYSLEQIIAKCTQKSVDRRYQSMNDVIADLKQSLVEPNGRFVTLTPLEDHSQTVTITPAQVAEIRAQKKASEMTDNGKKTYGSTEAAQKPRSRRETDYPDEEPGDDIEETEDGISSRLEHAMTIGGFIIGILIIVVLIYFIGRAAGLFKMNGQTASSPASTSQVVETTSQSGSSTAVPEQVQVPVIIGMTQEEAQAEANKYNLGVKYMGEVASTEYSVGQIVSQEPAAGTMVDKNTTISFYVASGAYESTIPEIVGLSQEEATAQLSAAGFNNINIVTQVDENIAVGTVVSVSPGAGETVMTDTMVTIMVNASADGTTNTGESQPAEVIQPTGEVVSVPAYTGLPEEMATEAARALGLNVQIEHGDSTDFATGDVIDQSVIGEAEVGSTLILTINTHAW